MRIVSPAAVLAVALAVGSGVASAGPRPLDACERACGHALAECLHELVPSGRASRRVYRQCRRDILGACKGQGVEVCGQPPTTTTTTLPAVPPVSLSGRWVLELELLEVFRCTTPSTIDSLIVDISQDGTALTATVRGNGSVSDPYRGQVTNAGFDLATSYRRRIQGRRCYGEVTLSAFGFGSEIPIVGSVSGACGRRFCGGTYIGYLTPEIVDGE